MVAGEGALVEHGDVGAGEGPLGVAGDGPLVVLDGQADVEHLQHNIVEIKVKRFMNRTQAHDGLKIDQDLPYFCANNFSRDKIKNKKFCRMSLIPR